MERDNMLWWLAARIAELIWYKEYQKFIICRGTYSKSKGWALLGGGGVARFPILSNICMYNTIPQLRAPLFGTKLLFKFRTCRGRSPSLSVPHFGARLRKCWGINFRPKFLLTYGGIKFLRTAFLPKLTKTNTKTNEWTIVGKFLRLSNMKLIYWGRQKTFGIVRWNGTISFGFSTNRPAESLAFLR